MQSSGSHYIFQASSSKHFVAPPVTPAAAASLTAQEQKIAAKADVKLGKARDFIAKIKQDEKRPVDKLALQNSIDALKSIHDSKLRGVPDPFASGKYERESNNFFKAIGVSDQERHRAERAGALSGEAYAASQVPIALTRFIPVAIRESTTVAAKIALTLARGSSHAGIGAAMKPFADAVADLTKDGQPAPTFMGLTSRRDLLKQMKSVTEFAAKVIKSCKAKDIKVPEAILKNLEQLKKEYVYRNGQGFVFGAFGGVSYTCELMKSALEDIGNFLTGGTDPLTGPIVNTVTAGIYAVSSPLEELAVLRTMITQTAKYADVFTNGEVDEKKARKLWSTREQTKLDYIGKAAARRFSDSINEMREAKGRIAYLENACAEPSVAAAKIGKQGEKVKQEIAHLERQLVEQKKFVARNDKRQVEMLQEVFRNESKMAAAEKESLLRQFRPELEQMKASLPQDLKNLLVEARKLPPESDQSSEAGDEFTAKDVLQAYDQTINDLSGATANMLGSGEEQLTGIEKKLKKLRAEQALLGRQYKDVAAAASDPNDPSKLDAMKKVFEKQKEVEQKKLDEAQATLQADMRDYGALKTALKAESTGEQMEAALESMNKDGFVFRMMTSKSALLSEATKVRYTDPLIVEKLLAERVPLAVAIAGVQSWVNEWSPATTTPAPAVPATQLQAADVVTNFKYSAPINVGIAAMQDRMANNNGAKLFMKLPPAPFSTDLTTALGEVGFTGEGGVPPGLEEFDLGLNPHRFGHARLMTETDSKLKSMFNEASAHAAHSLANTGHSLLETALTPYTAFEAKRQRHKMDKLIEDARRHNSDFPAQAAGSSKPENTASSLPT